jgi:hypothetical protein
MHRLGGSLELANAADGGLVAGRYFPQVPAESDSRQLFMRHMIRRAAAPGGADPAAADADQGKVFPAAR